MQIHSAKQEALEAIQRLPDTADMEEIMYQLCVLENIRRGQQDAAEGKTRPAEELLNAIQSW
jgi:predicted transcriptional regulator